MARRLFGAGLAMGCICICSHFFLGLWGSGALGFRGFSFSISHDARTVGRGALSLSVARRSASRLIVSGGCDVLY